MSEDCDIGTSSSRLERAAAGLGDEPLTEAGVAAELRPLFSQTLAGGQIYLANHSLGRPLDAVEDDVLEGLRLWQGALSGAWGGWLSEEASYRAQLATLLGAARVDCVVPRGSAGEGLRTVLNMLPAGARVVSTEGEFDSAAMLLRQYAELGRIELVLVGASLSERGAVAFEAEAIAERVRKLAKEGREVALVVVSQVFFATGQLLGGLDELARVCHENGTRLLVDSYHSLGAVPVDVAAMGCDYMIGGCYKYLRGGPGAAFLYLSPEMLEAGVRPLDTGWFALEPGGLGNGAPRLRAGGDAFLGGTFAVLTRYQAQSGLAFTRAVGVERLRAYGLGQLQGLKALLEERGIASSGGDAGHGAFLTVECGAGSDAVVARLAAKGIVVNARFGRLRICPDCLTTGEELAVAAGALGECRGWMV